MHVCVLQPHSDLRLFVRARRVLHHHGVVLMEGDRHHAGELPAPLHPQVPAQTFLPAQLLQADLLNTERSLRPHSLLENGKMSWPSSCGVCAYTRESNMDSSPFTLF